MKKSWIWILAAIPLVAIASVIVWSAAGDDSRRLGALGADESVNLSWHGDWSAEMAYAAGSVVTYDGVSYVAETEKLSTPKPNCGDCGWTQMALQSAPAEEKGSATELSGYEIVKGDLVIPPGSSNGTTTVDCPDGKKVFGGGGYSVDLKFGGPVGPDTPFSNGGVYGWRFGATYQGGGATLYVYAICANAS